MNDSERSQLEALRARQQRLEKEIADLSLQLQALESSINPQVTEKPSSPVAGLQPVPPILTGPAAKPFPIPPVIAETIAGSTTPTRPASRSEDPTTTIEAGSPLRLEAPPVRFAKALCQSCGGDIEIAEERLGETIACAYCGQVTVLARKSDAPPIIPSPARASEPAPRAHAAAAKAPEKSFEMRLGTFWLVRIGIVMVLTGLVFFGNFAYQRFIVNMGPGGKIALLYFASGLLLGGGAWWQRRSVKESLKNYAQVLFAGGLAGVYFTTYAAHHFEHLRVIQSAALDGLLLLGWAGFIVWIADRRKSEVLALFAIGLAYYSSVMTRVGAFTLYSNLVLAAASVFFLVRNRWAGLSLASLIASYAAYAFWRFFDGSAWHWASPGDGLWSGACFLMSYWAVFTAAVFLSRHEKLSGENRAGFLTLNNGAFFALFLMTMLQVQQGGFWKFSLIYGTVLLVLAEVSRRLLAAEPLVKNTYLTQGLLLVTLGFVTNPKFAGLQLALVLAAESVVLLRFGLRRRNLVLIGAGYISSVMSVGWGIDGMRQFEPAGVYLGAALGGLMLVNAFFLHRSAAATPSQKFRPGVGFFAGLALIAWLVATWLNCSATSFPLVLLGLALVITTSVYAFKLPELTVLGQIYVLLALAAELVNLAKPGTTLLWWNPLLMISMTLALSHWWQKQTTIKQLELGSATQLVCALGIVGTMYFWFAGRVEPSTWLAVTALIALGLTAYGVVTRAWVLAACGQIFIAVTGAQFVMQLATGKPAWWLPLVPIAVLGTLSLATLRWFDQKPDPTTRISGPLLLLSAVYRWAALLMVIWWVCVYVPERERVWVFAAIGSIPFAYAGARRKPEALLFSAALSLAGLVIFWAPLGSARTAYIPDLLAMLVLLAEQQVAARLPERFSLQRSAQTALILVGSTSIWLFVSRWVLENASGFYLTASWSALALVLFTFGIVLRERIYRFAGLGILACALARVVIIDVWKLEVLYRVLSFLALGVALLVLGFVYNKYQERIREWL